MKRNTKITIAAAAVTVLSLTAAVSINMARNSPRQGKDKSLSGADLQSIKNADLNVQTIKYFTECMNTAHTDEPDKYAEHIVSKKYGSDLDFCILYDEYAKNLADYSNKINEFNGLYTRLMAEYNADAESNYMRERLDNAMTLWKEASALWTGLEEKSAKIEERIEYLDELALATPEPVIKTEPTQKPVQNQNTKKTENSSVVSKNSYNNPTETRKTIYGGKSNKSAVKSEVNGEGNSEGKGDVKKSSQ